MKEGLGVDGHKWGNQTLAAYTWCRTNKGPHHSWLHKVNKIPDGDCPECGEEETEEHIVFQCRGHQEESRKLGDVQGWADLDKPRCRREGENRYDAV